MSKEKQTPCEAARSRWTSGNPMSKGMKEAFAAGFRAGEEGRAELLEALNLAQGFLEDYAGECIQQDRPDKAHVLCALSENIRDAISKHTAK